jgi:hypothetical protein
MLITPHPDGQGHDDEADRERDDFCEPAEEDRPGASGA